MLTARPHADIYSSNWNPSSPISIYRIYVFSYDVLSKKQWTICNKCNIHNFPTRSHNDLHLPIANQSVFQKGVYYSRVKFFNNLPGDLKQTFYDICKFKKTLKKSFLTTPSTHLRNIIPGNKLSLVNNNNNNCQYYLTFKRWRFKCPVLAADRNFSWRFKRLPLWLV
jgi:hypothetical protein